MRLLSRARWKQRLVVVAGDKGGEDRSSGLGMLFDNKTNKAQKAKHEGDQDAKNLSERDCFGAICTD